MRLLQLATAAAVILSANPSMVWAEERAERIVGAWSEWVADNAVEKATLAVLRGDAPLAERAVGVAPDSALPLASLGKVVTAACVAELAQSGMFALDDTLRQHFTDVVAPLSETTVADLLTHSSGLWPDSTQNDAGLMAERTPQITAVARRALERTPEGERGQFAYNNENYAVLGALVEKAMGSDYGDVCGARVLEPLGIETAAMKGRWASQGSWGGWSMSAADFGKLVASALGPDSAIGSAPGEWPNIEVGGGARYGMGALWRATPERTVTWSMGTLCWQGDGDGGYAASYGNGWTVVVLIGACLADPASLRHLDRALFLAATR